jgi:hypothetical protein
VFRSSGEAEGGDAGRVVAGQVVLRLGDLGARRLLNQTIFTKLWMDADEVVTHELREPFEAILGAYGRESDSEPHRRADAPSGVYYRAGRESGTPWRDAAYDLESQTSTDMLAMALGGRGSSKPVLVEVAGIEPASFSTSPGLLRAQSALRFSAPAVTQTSRRAGSVAVRCPD